MSYYEESLINSPNPDVLLGRKIYMEALAGRRGFRDDQIGIFDVDIWKEIFIAIVVAARKGIKDDKN